MRFQPQSILQLQISILYSKNALFSSELQIKASFTSIFQIKYKKAEELSNNSSTFFNKWHLKIHPAVLRHAADVEKHTQTRKPLRQAYKGTLRSGWLCKQKCFHTAIFTAVWNSFYFIRFFSLSRFTFLHFCGAWVYRQSEPCDAVASQGHFRMSGYIIPRLLRCG